MPTSPVKEDRLCYGQKVLIRGKYKALYAGRNPRCGSRMFFPVKPLPGYSDDSQYLVYEEYVLPVKIGWKKSK